MKNSERIHLSPPHMGREELEFVREAFASNWIAPVGPHINAFEEELAAIVGVANAAAVASGTAALHLALKILDVSPGDEVICSSFTFAASANPIVYEGAKPVFIDSERQTWNLDPTLLKEELDSCLQKGKLPKAVIVVDLYGECADYDVILDVCSAYGVPVIEDSAEALGARYKGRAAGSFGVMGVFSFNGNKIITTSGGGMLVSDDTRMVERARYLATQARENAPHYQHSTVGYNYRLSNVLAGIGRGQLQTLDARIELRRRNREYYKAALGNLPGLSFAPHALECDPNYWMTCVIIDPGEFGATREDVRLALEEANIESRPVWKPLHLQPVFSGCRMRGGQVSEEAFENGLCLPSGSSLTESDLSRICDVVDRAHRCSKRRFAGQPS